MLHKNSGANVSPGACWHIMYIHGGKKNIKGNTQVKKKEKWTQNTQGVCCSDALEEAAEWNKLLFHHSTAYTLMLCEHPLPT